MNDKDFYIEQITSLLNRYTNDLITNGKFNFLNSHVHAEYFLKQLLNHVCPKWNLKHTSEYYSHNTSSIDLFSEDNGLVVQVTAQSSNHREKIEKTIEKYNRDWKTEFPFLRIFFIKDINQELVKEFQTDKIKIISFRNIIAKVQSGFSVEQTFHLLEFLKQQLSTTYNNTPYTFEEIELFSDYKTGKENNVISSNFLYKNKLLFYSPTDNDRIEKLQNALSKNKNAKVFLEGPPCVGKTTLTFELENQISKELIKTFYIDITGYGDNDSGIKKDIDKISVHDALLIVDNSQENFDLAENIYAWLNKRQVRALFISRFISNSQSSAAFSNYDFDVRLNLNSDFEDNSILKRKIDGIIQNRIKYLNEKYPQFKWIVKDMNTVYANSELNFLKLSIILYFWEKEYQEFLLEQIGNDKLYTSFYDHHKLKNHDDQIVFKYASLFKYDYPFLLANIDDQGISQLINTGIILKRKFYEHYFFPHVEYANLLAKAIAYKKEYTADREATAIIQYISEKKPNNIQVLLNNLGAKNKTEILNQILSNPTCSVFINEHYNNKSVKASEMKLFFFSLYEFRNVLSKQSIKEFLQNFISAKQHIVFNLFEKDGYESYQNLSRCVAFYEVDASHLSEFYLHNKSGKLKRAEGKSFFEISELLTKNTREPKFIMSLANSFSYPEWSEMFKSQPGFSLKAEGINNLRKNTLSRQLADDLYNELDITYSFHQLKGAEIDVIGKALSDLSEFEAVDFKGKPRQILKLLFENGSLRDATKSGLSKFAIGIAHLSKTNTEIVEALFPTPEEINSLFLNASANDFAQRVPLFVKHFPTGKALFIDVIRKAIVDKKFLSSDKNDLNGLIKLIELLSNPDYGFSKDETKHLTELAIKQVSDDESLIHLSDAAHKLKSVLSEDDIYNLVSSERISNELSKDKISIKHLEPILIQNIKKISSKISYNIYTGISLQTLAKASIAANSQTPVSFEQLTKVFMLLYNLERTYFGNNNLSDSFTGKLIYQLIKEHHHDFNHKAKRASLYDFIIGYTRLFDIDKNLTEGEFSRLLTWKAKDTETAEITLSNFSQAIRRLATLKGNGQINYKSLADIILQNTKPHLIKNAEGIDIGKISTGLQELSIEFKDFSENLFHDLRFIILDKGKKESKRADFIARVIPELMSAASKDIDVIQELKSYSK